MKRPVSGFSDLLTQAKEKIWFSSVYSLSRVQLFATLRVTARQASLSAQRLSRHQSSAARQPFCSSQERLVKLCEEGVCYVFFFFLLNFITLNKIRLEISKSYSTVDVIQGLRRRQQYYCEGTNSVPVLMQGPRRDSQPSALI